MLTLQVIWKDGTENRFLVNDSRYAPIRFLNDRHEIEFTEYHTRGRYHIMLDQVRAYVTYRQEDEQEDKEGDNQ